MALAICHQAFRGYLLNISGYFLSKCFSENALFTNAFPAGGRKTKDGGFYEKKEKRISKKDYFKHSYCRHGVRSDFYRHDSQLCKRTGG